MKKHLFTGAVSLLLCAAMLCAFLPVSAFAVEEPQKSAVSSDLTETTMPETQPEPAAVLQEATEPAIAEEQSTQIQATDTAETPALGVTSGTTGDCTWTLDGTELTISGNGKMGDYSYTYNQSVSAYVTNAPWGYTITKVNIQFGVTYIGWYSFLGSCLISVSIPDSVTVISSGAFEGCSSLSSVSIGNNVASIGGSTFARCSHLTSIVIPDSTTFIDEHAFYNCSNLNFISIPNSVNRIGEYAFYNCSNLKHVCYGGTESSKNNISIGSYNTCLTNAEWHYDTDATVGIFGDCFWILYGTELDICGNGKICDFTYRKSDSGYVTNAPWGSNVKKVTIQSGVTAIGKCAFLGCSNLVSITIPNSVSLIGENAFYNCSDLEDVYYDGTTSSKNSITIEPYNTCLTSAIWHDNSSSGSIGDRNWTLEGTVLTIYGNGPMEDYSETSCDKFSYLVTTAPWGYAITEVIIQPGVTSIGKCAFSGCTSLKSITIPAGITSIGFAAFSNCRSWANATIPSSITSVGDYAFYNCYNLKDIYYGGTVTSKGKILVGGSNTTLSNATWHYATCETTGHAFKDDTALYCYACGEARRRGPDVTILSYSTTQISVLPITGAEYSIDGITYQASNTFKGLTPGTTYTVYARYLAEGTQELSAVSTAKVILKKKTQPLVPKAPTMFYSTNTSLALETVDGCEYSVDGEIWQSSPIFTELIKGNVYTFYQRYAESGTTLAGKTSSGAAIEVGKREQIQIPSAPVAIKIAEDSVELRSENGCEYSMSGTTWQTSPVFNDLECVTEYIFYQRYAETETTLAGPSSAGAAFKTAKGTQAAPSAPQISEVTQNTVTLVAVEGCQYSCDTVTWQDSPVFTGLDSETGYAFFARYAETDRYLASDASAYTIATTKPAGDMNGDDFVTSDDAIYLLKYVFVPDNYPIAGSLNPDCNGDSEVNSDDAIYLLKYVFSPESYPLS